MSAAAVLGAARAAGLTVTVRNGKLAISGVGDRRPDLVEAIRQHRNDIIVAITADAANKANEEKKVFELAGQPVPLALLGVMPSFFVGERARLIARVMSEGMQAIGWCMMRANAYFERFPDSNFEDQDASAAADYLNTSSAMGR